MSNIGYKRDTYNKSIAHQWFHHATWGAPKYKNEGVGKVLWHSLTENGKVEFVNIKFKNKVYENVSIKDLKPINLVEHQHETDDDSRKKKKVKETIMTKKIAEQKLGLFLEKNVPTNPGKWNYYKSQAKKKFDVYPSAYANAWAAKMYKKAGGGWKKG